MSTYTLRAYQQRAVDAGIAYLTDPKWAGRNGLIVQPTGAGKSLVIANVVRALDGPCVVLQPSREILAQNAAKLASYGERAAVFSASFDRREIGRITLATIGSVIHHADAFRDMRYVLIDEAHQAVNPKGGQYLDFLDVLGDARILGLSVADSTVVELAGNVFGSGFVGSISAAFDLAAEAYVIERIEDVDIIDVACAYARGWNGTAFSWRPLRRLIRHRHQGHMHRVMVRGQSGVTTTALHSVYIAEPGERVRTYPHSANKNRKHIAVIANESAAQITLGDVLVADDGASWEGIATEPVIDMVTFAARYMPTSRVRVRCDVSSVGLDRLASVAYGKRARAMARRWISSSTMPLSAFIALGREAPHAERLSLEGSAHSIAARITLSDWAYMLGFYLGDGWLANDQPAEANGGRFGFAVENSLVAQILKRLRELPGVEWDPQPQPNRGSGSTEVRASSYFVYRLVELTCGRRRCYEKSIPGEWIVTWPRSARLELLRGLVDSDGHDATRDSGRRSSSVHSTSRKLADTLMSLLRSLGVNATLHEAVPSIGGVVDGRRIIGRRNSYVVIWSCHALEGNSRGHHGHRQRFIHRDCTFTESVVRSNVAVPYDGHVYDIEMESGHPSFVANGLLVHNTATPFRLASNSFGSELRFLTRTRPRIFRDVVDVTQISEMTSGGFWAPIEYRRRSAIDRARLKMNSTGADYTDASVQRHLIETGFVGRLVDEVEALVQEGRRHILVFTRFVDESERLARALPGVAVVTAETPERERDRIITEFRAGRIKVVSNCGVLTLGFDFPALDTVVIARPSISLSLYYQMVGRAVRPHPSKAGAVVLDMVGLVDRFGPVEDLRILPGGYRGEQWAVYSGERPLTNCYFAQRDDMDPVAAQKAQRKRKFWARKMGGGRQWGR